MGTGRSVSAQVWSFPGLISALYGPNELNTVKNSTKFFEVWQPLRCFSLPFCDCPYTGVVTDSPVYTDCFYCSPKKYHISKYSVFSECVMFATVWCYLSQCKPSFYHYDCESSKYITLRTVQVIPLRNRETLTHQASLLESCLNRAYLLHWRPFSSTFYSNQNFNLKTLKL